MTSKYIIYIPTDTREATAASFSKVAGIPLFMRAILSLNQAGETAFTIVAPLSHRRHILKLWQKVAKKRQIHLNIVFVKEGQRLTKTELLELKDYAEPSSFFIHANYVLPGIATTLGLTRRIGAPPPPNGQPRLPANGLVAGRVAPTVTETSLRINPHEVYILKHASRRNAIVGFALQNMDDLIKRSEDSPLTIEECLDVLIRDKNHHYLHEGGESIIVQKFSEIKIAEEILAENIRKNTGTFVARELNKRISLPISLVLAKMRIAPNTITVINIFIGLCAGIGAAGRTYKGVLLGAILFQLASIIDGCDGEVAKFTFRTSKFGQYIDSLSDNLSLAAFLTGMMIHKYRITGSYVAFMWGAALILGALLIILIMSAYLSKYTNSASFVTYDKEFLQRLSPERTPKLIQFLLKHFKMLFKKDLFSLMFLIFAIFGVLSWWFYIMTIGVWVAAAVLGYLGLNPERYKKIS